MRINPVSVKNYANINFGSNVNFRGSLVLDKDMYSLCGLDQDFIKDWENRLPDKSSVEFVYQGDDDSYTKSYSYTSLANNQTTDNGLLYLSTYGIRSWDTYNEESWEAKQENKNKLNKCLNNCLESIRRKLNGNR